MFDFSRYIRLLALLLPAYLLFVVLWVIVMAVAGAGFGHDLPSAFLWWPLPCIFPIAALVTVVHGLAGTVSGRVARTELTGSVFACWLFTFGSALALSSHHAHSALPVIVSGACLAILFVTRMTLGVTHRADAAADRSAAPATTSREARR